MIKKWIFAFLVLPVAGSLHASDWERLGDWEVKAQHDDMDTVARVGLMTSFKETPKEGRGYSSSGDLRIGFTIFGGKLVSLDTSVGFSGDAYWPECDYDMSSISVDGKKAVRLASEDNPGDCNNVALDGLAIKQMLSGRVARVRIGTTDGVISLKGFRDAWNRAKKLSKI